MEKTQITAMPI